MQEKANFCSMGQLKDLYVVRDVDTNGLKLAVVYDREDQFEAFKSLLESYGDHIILNCKNPHHCKRVAKSLRINVKFSEDEMGTRISGPISTINYFIMSLRARQLFSKKNGKK